MICPTDKPQPKESYYNQLMFADSTANSEEVNKCEILIKDEKDGNDCDQVKQRDINNQKTKMILQSVINTAEGPKRWTGKVLKGILFILPEELVEKDPVRPSESEEA